VDGDVTLLESPAICLYLADRFPEKQLAPPPGSADRGPYYQWLLFAEGSVDAAVMAFYWHAQLPEEQKALASSQEDLAKHRTRLNEVLGVVDTRLEGREYLVAERFTAADVVMASILHLANQLGLLGGHPRLVEYVRRHTQRPAVRRAVSA
jgi:glutathione S-transferase